MKIKDIQSVEFIPHDYQEPIIELVRPATAFGIFAFPGSGKTVISLDTVYQHKQPTLIIAPLDVMYTTWFRENKKWTFSRKLRFTVLHGPRKDARFHLNRGVYFINPEGLKWLIAKIKRTKRFPWKILIVDESVKFKNHKSVQFGELCKMLNVFERRIILSGNPIPNHYLDLWAQMYILDQGKRLGKSWYQFRQKYFYPTDYMRYSWELKPGSKEEIIEAISDITYFLESDDDTLPERIEITVPVIMPPAAMKQYRQMEDKLWIEMDEGRVVADTTSSALMKCWQIANGFLYESEERPHPTDPDKVIKVRIRTHYIHNELAKAAIHVVDELQGESILIGYHFKEDIVRLKAAFPNACVVESGAKPAWIHQVERDWNNNKIEILLVHVNKFSHGLNLQLGRGHHVMFYALTYNFDTYDQLIRRFQRQGAEFSNVIVHKLVVQATIHEAILINVAKKEADSLDFLNSLREYRESIG